jgi:hypothetical protein
MTDPASACSTAVSTVDPNPVSRTEAFPDEDASALFRLVVGITPFGQVVWAAGDRAEV